jgi:hypothetical protein
MQTRLTSKGISMAPRKRFPPVYPFLLFAAVLAFATVLRAEPAAGKPKPADKKAEEKKSEPQFMRVERDTAGNPLALQTAIVRYAKAGKDKPDLYVDLVGAVHVGDTAYYEALNKRFQGYDALLYELVAPAGTRVPKHGAKSRHPIGQLQQSMKGLLDLDYQLERVDYHQDNFVHADMSPDDFSKSMSDRGESMWTMIFRMMGYSIAQQNKHPERAFEAQLLAALFDPNRPMALKRLIAGQFEDMGDSIGALDGPEGSTIITERNKVALGVLSKEIAAGKKHLGIFYGAGHLPDMDKRLQADFGLKPVKTEWLTAWELRDPVKKPAGKPAQ